MRRFFVHFNLFMRYTVMLIVFFIALSIAGLWIYNIGSLLGIFPNRELYCRTATYYVGDTFRDTMILLEDAWTKDKHYPPGKPYWGPLTPSLIKAIGGSPSIIIDPYNREGKPELWRTGPHANTDRGAPIRVKGLDYWYYTNGTDFWALVSRGPDGVLDVTTQSLVSPGLAWNQFRYDPSNGTESQGDIVRLKEY